jgi:Domain of unknown function (DUF6697)
MTFVIGEHYDRQYIHDELGGELDHYLPQKENKIVCGCFRPEDNPRVPDEVLVGKGAIIMKKAQRFILQREYIPVFIRRDANAWEYMGDYRVQGCLDTATVIERKQREAGRTDVTRILYLERMPT